MNHEVEITTCRELLGLYPPEEAPKTRIKVARVNLGEFEQLQGGGRELIRSFSERALRQSACRPENSFEPFIFAWIALNSWASCVTGVDSDLAYLSALTLDHELNQRFGRKRSKFPSGVVAGSQVTLSVWVASGGRWKRSVGLSS